MNLMPGYKKQVARVRETVVKFEAGRAEAKRVEAERQAAEAAERAKIPKFQYRTVIAITPQGLATKLNKYSEDGWETCGQMTETGSHYSILIRRPKVG
jgi:hypothetical protein